MSLLRQLPRPATSLAAVAIIGLAGLCLAGRNGGLTLADDTSARLVLRQTEVDVGDVPLGTAPTGAILVGNGGGQRLIVNPEVGKCGWCSDDFTLIVPANERRLLPFRLDVQPHPGLLSQAIRFHTNDPATPTFIVTIRGRVRDTGTEG